MENWFCVTPKAWRSTAALLASMTKLSAVSHLKLPLLQWDGCHFVSSAEHRRAYVTKALQSLRIKRNLRCYVNELSKCFLSQPLIFLKYIVLPLINARETFLRGLLLYICRKFLAVQELFPQNTDMPLKM